MKKHFRSLWGLYYNIVYYSTNKPNWYTWQVIESLLVGDCLWAKLLCRFHCAVNFMNSLGVELHGTTSKDDAGETHYGLRSHIIDTIDISVMKMHPLFVFVGEGVEIG